MNDNAPPMNAMTRWQQPVSSRRTFLKRTGGAAAIAIPYFVPRQAFGANDRVVLGYIGMGGQGRHNLEAFGFHAAAISDVDQQHLARGVKIASEHGIKCDAYGDFRRLLDRKDIDAVVISTPDHWHALQTIAACQSGKDVYCEKPLSLTIGEGRRMVETARKHDRVVQTGSQQRTRAEFRRACELVRSGRIGALKEVHVNLAGVNFKGPAVADSVPPEQLDFDLWLGPAPLRPYNRKRVHYNFRFFWDYSGGQMTNWGAHDIDIAQWGMDADGTGPIETEGTGTFHEEGWFEVTTSCRVTHRYKNGVELIVTQDPAGPRGGVRFVGTDGEIYANRGVLRSSPASIVDERLGQDDVRLPQPVSHQQNFLDAIKTRSRPLADVEIGHRSATVCHLGNIALRLGRKVRWDPVEEDFIDDRQASAMRLREYRAPWEL